MHGIYEAVGFLLLFIFICGFVSGFFVTTIRASSREDKWGSLRGTPPDSACAGARRVNGIGRRDALPDWASLGADQPSGHGGG